MDDQAIEKLGKTIAEATVKANEAMMPGVSKMIGEMATGMQTGVVTEIESEELAVLLRARGEKLRERAEEFAAEKPEVVTAESILEAMPHYQQEEAEARAKTPAGAHEIEATVRRHNERIVKRHQEQTKSVIGALRVEVERLEFMASHLMKRTYRLDTRELDDLLFSDRHGHSYVGRVGVGFGVA